MKLGRGGGIIKDVGKNIALNKGNSPLFNTKVVGKNIKWGRHIENLGKKIKIKKLGVGKNVKYYGIITTSFLNVSILKARLGKTGQPRQ